VSGLGELFGCPYIRKSNIAREGVRKDENVVKDQKGLKRRTSEARKGVEREG